jgi:hypothetical protein
MPRWANRRSILEGTIGSQDEAFELALSAERHGRLRFELYHAIS